MRRFLAALLAAVFWAPMASAAPAPSYPLTPPPYNSSAKALGSINGQVVNFPLWGIAQTIIYGNPTIGHCSVWVSGPNGLQLGDGSCSGGGGVSSVGLTLPGQFNCTGTPVTGSGTIDCTWGAANANTIFAGPSSGSASTPTFRALTIDDLFGGTGASSSTFLRGDGTWASAGGGSCNQSASSATAEGCLGVPQSGGAFKTANYTTLAADAAGEVVLNGTGAITLTVAANSSVAYPVGTVIDVTNVGTAADTITSSDTLDTASGGTIVTGSVILPVGSTAFLHKLGATTWLVTGAPPQMRVFVGSYVVSGSSTSAVASSSLTGGVGIPSSGYNHLLIRIVARTLNTADTNGNGNIQLQLNGDTTTAHYASSQYGFFTSGGSQSSGSVSATANGIAVGHAPNSYSSSLNYGISEILVANYAQSSVVMPIMSSSYMNPAGGTVRRYIDGATYTPSAIITAFQLTAYNDANTSTADFAAGTLIEVYAEQ